MRVLIVAVVTSVLFSAAVFTSRASAQTKQASPDSLVASGVDDNGRIRLVPNKSTVITTKRAQKRISVAEPSIVDVVGISPMRVLVTAKKIGSTQLIIWDEEDRSQSIDVIVQADVSGLREQIDKLYPDNKIDAATSDDAVLLTGKVNSLATAEAVEKIASAYSKRVINLLEVIGGQQVMLEVVVAEVARSATDALGVNYAFSDGVGFGGVNIGQVNPFSTIANGGGGIADSIPPNPSVTLFGGGQIGGTAFRVFITALRENNLMRILAQPNLTAISGQEASFLAGGEFPIPVPQGGTGGGTTITIEFKEFGVRLRFVPIVMGDGRIRLNLAPEVSDLDFTTAVRFGGFVVPGLTQRRVKTTVELNDGQSFAIAGLLNQNVTAVKSVVPLLGDLPVLGTLFRSVRYQRKETELVILVTPRIVSPMNPDQIPPIPGQDWRHPDEFNLFFHQDIGSPEGGPTTQPAGSRRGAPRRYYGSHGFSDATDAQAADATLK